MICVFRKYWSKAEGQGRLGCAGELPRMLVTKATLLPRVSVGGRGGGREQGICKFNKHPKGF